MTVCVETWHEHDVPDPRHAAGSTGHGARRAGRRGDHHPLRIVERGRRVGVLSVLLEGHQHASSTGDHEEPHHQGRHHADHTARV